MSQLVVILSFEKYHLILIHYKYFCGLSDHPMLKQEEQSKKQSLAADRYYFFLILA
jgi:hypothetical protein